MRRVIRVMTCVVVFGSVALVMAELAEASIDIVVPNSDLSNYAAPYGYVDLTLIDSTNVSVKFTANAPYLFAGESAVALNLSDAASVAFPSSFSWTVPSGFTGPSSIFSKTGNVSEFGSFNFGVKFHGGFEGAVTSLTFTLTRSSGTWSSLDDVLTPNANGYVVAAHIFVANADYSDAIVTGYAGDIDDPVVPEPSTIIVWTLLFAASWLGMRVWRR